MEVPFKQGRDIFSLIYSILWGGYAVLGFLKDHLNWIDYLASICSVIYFLFFLFDKKKYFLNIELDTITTQFFFGERIKLSEIRSIIETDKKIIVKSHKNVIEVNKELINSHLLSELKKTLKMAD